MPILLALVWLLHTPLSLGAQERAVRTSVAPTAIRVASCDALRQVRERPAAPTLAFRGSAVRWAEWSVVLGARSIPATMVVVEIDPRRIRLELDIAREGGALGAWSLNDAPSDAVLAVNAGQFTDDGPWGWVLHNGREWQQPGRGALAGAVIIDSADGVHIIDAREIPAARTKNALREAMQSFPLILRDGRAPDALCAPDAIDQTHRDIRLVLATRPDGRVLLILSRFSGVGGLASQLPIGPTTLEMAEIVRRLGADRALMLDGGLSAQLLLRDGAETHRWNGLRGVPLALVGRVALPMQGAAVQR